VRRVIVPHDELVEGRDHVSPRPATVVRPVVPTVVVAETRVVLSRDEIPRVRWIDGDDLLRLSAERAVLVDANVVRTALSGDADVLAPLRVRLRVWPAAGNPSGLRGCHGLQTSF